MEKKFTLLCAEGIYGLYRYASMIAVRSQGKVELANEANRVYNFKKYGANAALVEAQIRAVAEHFGCGEIVAVPGHTTAESRLQEIFGAKLRRTADTEPRKYNHRAEIDYKAYAATLALEPLASKAVLVVDDICTTGKTMAFYGEYFKRRRIRATLLCVGLNHKMNPVESEHTLSVEEPEADARAATCLPAARERTADFLARMKGEFEIDE